MAERPRDHVNVPASGQGERRVRVSQIVKADEGAPRTAEHPPEPPLDSAVTHDLAVDAGKHEIHCPPHVRVLPLVVLAQDVEEPPAERQRTAAARRLGRPDGDRLAVRLEHGLRDLHEPRVDVDVPPRQGQEFTDARARRSGNDHDGAVVAGPGDGEQPL